MNRVIITGNLTKDPELRYTNNQTAVCRFTVAVNDKRKNPTTGEYEDKASFLPVTVWGRQGENCEKFIRKGSKVLIEGRIQTGSYQKQDGTKVNTTDIIANNVEFLSPRDEPRSYPPTNDGQQISYQTPPGFEQMAQNESVPF